MSSKAYCKILKNVGKSIKLINSRPQTFNGSVRHREYTTSFGNLQTARTRNFKNRMNIRQYVTRHSVTAFCFLRLIFTSKSFVRKIASYVGKFTFRLSVTEVTYNFYIRQTIAKSWSKNCPYKVKKEKLKE